MSRKIIHHYLLYNFKIIKVTSKEITNENEYQFLNILSDINPPNTPQLIKSHSSNKKIVYRYIKGYPLYKEYKWLWQQSFKIRLTLFKNLLNIVQIVHLHKNIGLLHNDITPGNILISNRKKIHLIDFGNATSHTNSKTIITHGKPHYASPEQKNGLPTTQQSDIFQLGCILFELTLKNQYQDINDIPQYDLSSLDINTELRSILISFLSEEPKDRCQNIKECIELIDRFYK